MSREKTEHLIEKIVNLKMENEDLRNLVKTIEGFLDSLPEGWLAKTSGDVGALNDFYCKLQKIDLEKSALLDD